jgi:dGTPase
MELFDHRLREIVSSSSGLEEIQLALNERENRFLFPLAARSQDAVRRKLEVQLEKDYRQSYSVDVDRILHSLAYSRYFDKTQVFYLIKNDHITHRMLHVQMVSKIARTIGRFTGLNEDLIEAIAIGHDIGHAPFGHDGERILSEICLENGIGHFLHNVQSVQFLENVERKGRGWNLTLQSLDGILCHDGEIHEQRLKPDRSKTLEDLDREISLKKKNPAFPLAPMTLEGCVVRMADTISYIGRDVEDAIRLKIIKRSELPKQSIQHLGNTNGSIVYSLVTDVIRSSFGNPFLAFSPEVSEALRELKAFNLERIYLNPLVKRHLNTIANLFVFLFDKFLSDIERDFRQSVIFSEFLDGMSDRYLTAHNSKEIVRDFIAGMTDQYFLQQCPQHLRPPVQRM